VTAPPRRRRPAKGAHPEEDNDASGGEEKLRSGMEI